MQIISSFQLDIDQSIALRLNSQYFKYLDLSPQVWESSHASRNSQQLKPRFIPINSQVEENFSKMKN